MLGGAGVGRQVQFLLGEDCVVLGTGAACTSMGVRYG